MNALFLFGDSIAYGEGDETGKGWVGRLEKDIKKKSVAITNYAVPGDTVPDTLRVLSKQCKKITPDIIMLAVGINDSQFHIPRNEEYCTKAAFEKNYSTLIQKAKEKAGKVIAIGLTPVDDNKVRIVPWKPDRNYDNARTKMFDAIIKKVCHKNNVLYIPVFDLLLDNDLADGLHPNGKGYEKMADRIMQELHSSFIP